MDIYSWADIADRIDPDVAREIEASYRRGYHHAMIDAAEYAKGDSRYVAWVADEIYKWRYHMSIDEMIPPPEFPTWKELRETILKRDKRICQYCGGEATVVDHVIPVSNDGGYEESNLVAACATCNRKKGTSMPGRW